MHRGKALASKFRIMDPMFTGAREPEPNGTNGSWQRTRSGEAVKESSGCEGTPQGSGQQIENWEGDQTDGSSRKRETHDAGSSDRVLRSSTPSGAQAVTGMHAGGAKGSHQGPPRGGGATSSYSMHHSLPGHNSVPYKLRSMRELLLPRWRKYYCLYSEARGKGMISMLVRLQHCRESQHCKVTVVRW